MFIFLVTADSGNSEAAVGILKEAEPHLRYCPALLPQFAALRSTLQGVAVKGAYSKEDPRPQEEDEEETIPTEDLNPEEEGDKIDDIERGDDAADEEYINGADVSYDVVISNQMNPTIDDTISSRQQLTLQES